MNRERENRDFLLFAAPEELVFERGTASVEFVGRHFANYGAATMSHGWNCTRRTCCGRFSAHWLDLSLVGATSSPPNHLQVAPCRASAQQTKTSTAPETHSTDALKARFSALGHSHFQCKTELSSLEDERWTSEPDNLEASIVEEHVPARIVLQMPLGTTQTDNS